MGNLALGHRAKSGYDLGKFGLNSRTVLIFRLPNSWAFRIVSRSLFLTMVIILLPSLGSVMTVSSSSSSNDALHHSDSGSSFAGALSILFRDLMDEGLIKKGHRGVILGDDDHVIDEELDFWSTSGGVDLVTEEEMDPQQVFDFMFVRSFSRREMIDRSVKDGGLVISQMGNDPWNELQFLGNYKMVYLRRFENTVVAVRKVWSSSNGSSHPPAERVSGGDDATEEEKKAALKGLEDAYLEPPPRAALMKRSRFTSRKIKFLPDLLKDSLKEYPRRVFISDDSNAVDWFYKNYPMRDQEFEVYDMEIGGSNNKDGTLLQETGVSSWLTKNVRREDYVVMKAEVEVVEEMLKDKIICLVDELFLECKSQWQHGKRKNGSKRAYWQCLALYGKVRDEGIAVHQWWN